MSYESMLNKAIELHNMGALNEALDIYQSLLQMTPENSDIWNLLGLISQSKDEHLKAIDSFLNAIKYSPKPFALYYFNLGLSYKAVNKKNEAKDAFLRAVNIDSQLKEAWNFLGVVLEECGKHNEAVKSFCKALDIDNDYEDARANLCFYTNDYLALEKLALAQENNFMLNLKAGVLLEDIEKKELFLRKAVSLEPDRVEGLMALADFLLSNNNKSEALVFYHKVLNLNDSNFDAILAVANIYLDKGDYANAEKYFNKSFEICRDNFDAYLNYGTLLYKQKKINQALEAYRKAININPESAEVSYNLSLILKDLGEFEEALGLMFNAYLRDSKNNLYAINIMETLAELALKNSEMALKIAQNWHNTMPDNIFSKRLLRGICGEQDEVNDEEYVALLFDEFAYTYDEKMANLDTKIIDKIKEIIPEIKGTVLDLGCGTGCVGASLHNGDVKFIGVDLSANMIDLARKKSVYEELYCESINTFIKNKKNLKDVDLVIASDVFCYLGDIDNILGNLKNKKIVFSVEKSDDCINKDYYLQANGRYKHSKKYILDIAKKYKFKNCDIYELSIRKEANLDVCGMLVYMW